MYWLHKWEDYIRYNQLLLVAGRGGEHVEEHVPFQYMKLDAREHGGLHTLKLSYDWFIKGRGTRRNRQT